MKIILASLFGLFIGTTPPPTAGEVADKFCSCGKPLVEVASQNVELEKKDPKAYANKMEKAAIQLQSCLGGQEGMEAMVKDMSYQQRMDFEQAVLKEMDSRCPDVAKGLKSLK
jgi:hypothetical protein